MRLVTLTLPDGRAVLVNPELVELVQVCTDPETSARTDISTLGAFAGVRVRETLEDVRRLFELAGAVSGAERTRSRRVDPSSSAALTSELLLRSLPDLEKSLEAFGAELVARVDRREGKEWRRWALQLAERLSDGLAAGKDPAELVDMSSTLLEASGTYGPTGAEDEPTRFGALLAVADAAHCFIRRARELAPDGFSDFQAAECFRELAAACAELDSLELARSIRSQNPDGERGTP